MEKRKPIRIEDDAFELDFPSGKIETVRSDIEADWDEEELAAMLQAHEDELDGRADAEDIALNNLLIDQGFYNEALENLEEHEDVVECKECFELFPKADCIKIVGVGYVCPTCNGRHCDCEADHCECDHEDIPVEMIDVDALALDFPEVEKVVLNDPLVPEEPTSEPIPEIASDVEPCVGPECEAPIEEPVVAEDNEPVTVEDNIEFLVADEHEAIDGYEEVEDRINSGEVEIEDEETKNKILDTLEHIKEEEVEHIEELEELLPEEEVPTEISTETPEESEEPEEDEKVLVESQTQELERFYDSLSKELGVDLDVLVYGEDGFMKERYPEGFPDFAGDVIYSEKYWTEFEEWCKEKGIELKEALTEGIWDKLKNFGNVFGKVGRAIKDKATKIADAFKAGKHYSIIADALFETNNNAVRYEVFYYDGNKAIVDENKNPIIKTFETFKEAEKDAIEGSKKSATAKTVIRAVPTDSNKEICGEEFEKLVPLKIFINGKIVGNTLEDKIIPAQKEAVDKFLATKKEADKKEKDLKSDVEKTEEESKNEEEPKNAKLNRQRANNKKIITAMKNAGLDVSKLTVKATNKNGREYTKASDLLNQLRKELFNEDLELEEHVNEEHPAIESDQEYVGADNAVVDCDAYTLVAHSEDEKPLNCKMKDKPLEKPLTEDLSKDKLQAMEDYLKSNDFASLDAYWEDGGDWHDDIVSVSLTYRENMFSLWFSIYHAGDDNNAEYPERHTKEDKFSYDSLAKMCEYKDCRELLDRLYDENLAKLDKSLSEDTHAQYAKPEGDRVAAYNNALKYAKQNNVPYIYGYTQQGNGKFFALEQPIKVKGGDTQTAEKEFRNQYKRCLTVYIAYPDKSFVENLTEELADWTLVNVGIDGDSLETSDEYISGDCIVYGEIENHEGKGEETVDTASFKFDKRDELIMVSGLSDDFTESDIAEIEEVLVDNLKTNF